MKKILYMSVLLLGLNIFGIPVDAGRCGSVELDEIFHGILDGGPEGVFFNCFISEGDLNADGEIDYLIDNLAGPYLLMISDATSTYGYLPGKDSTGSVLWFNSTDKEEEESGYTKDFFSVVDNNRVVRITKEYERPTKPADAYKHRLSCRASIYTWNKSKGYFDISRNILLRWKYQRQYCSDVDKNGQKLKREPINIIP